MIQRARKREKRSKVKKAPKRNRGVKKDGGRLKFKKKGAKTFGRPLKGTSTLEKMIGHKKKKKRGQKHEKRQQKKVKVEARTRNSTRSEKKKERVRKGFFCKAKGAIR